MTVAVVVLTMGDRPEALARLIGTLASEPFTERLVIYNGQDGPTLPGWTTHLSPENLGVPGGRNLGMQLTTAEVVVFIDDDAWLTTSTLVDSTQEIFTEHPALGALGYLIETAGGSGLNRWLPHRGSELAAGLRTAASFPGGAHALRRQAYVEAGGYTPEFFFKHEETDLSWALITAGWEVAHTESVVLHHPPTGELRHSGVIEQSIRNKIWLVRARLPWWLVPVAAPIVTARQLAMCRSVDDLKLFAQGARSGLGACPIRRQPLSWANIVELTRRGRPPIL